MTPACPLAYLVGRTATGAGPERRRDVTTSTDLARTGAVTDEFDHAAAAYDRLVAAHPGYHRDLRTSVRRLALPAPGAGLRLVDLGGATGASTTALLEAVPTATTAGVAASPAQLDLA